MKKWIMPIGLVVVICILAMNITMPICLADENRIEIKGVLEEPFSDVLFPNTFDRYSLGDLHKGDKVRVVMTELRGSGNVVFRLTRIPIYFSSSPYLPSPGTQGGEISDIGEEKILEIPSDGVYYLIVHASKGRINYKGYIEVMKE